MELIQQKLQDKKVKGSEPSLPSYPQIALVGNPNVGKSVVFGYLTGKYVTVSNYPGTTVEISRGRVEYKGQVYQIIDTPGTNSLIPHSEDERVARDILADESLSGVIQIGDAKNLFRTLYLTLQILETRLPMVLDLNMMDEARSRGIEIDCSKLESILGIPINTSVAIRKQGLDSLIPKLVSSTRSDFFINYGKEIEEAIAKIEAILPEMHLSKRVVALMLLSGDETLKAWIYKYLDMEDAVRISDLINGLSRRLNEPIELVIGRKRIQKVNEILRSVLVQKSDQQSGISRYLGNLAIHPIWGVPVLLLVLYLMYEVVGVFGAGTLVDFFEIVVFGKFINPAAIWLVNKILPIPLLKDFLVGEYGMITMAFSYGFAIVLPIVGTFFFLFSILEDSGYLPRLAVMMNRIFKVMGLNGKAVLPMVLGLGCDTMATLTTRILETRKERLIVTLLLALGIPCSAQLGVILAMTSMLPLAGTLIWAGVVLLILFLVGYFSSKILPGENSDFVIELPPIRMPSLINIFYKTLARIEWYLKEVIPLFVLGTAILFLLDKLHILNYIRIVASPLIENWLGLPQKATDAFLIGFLRRDYGAAGLFSLSKDGMLTNQQVLVSIITITLFMPCIANLLMIIKEQGWKIAAKMSAFILPLAFLVGGLVKWLLVLLEIKL